jgi:uncharacterized protein
MNRTIMPHKIIFKTLLFIHLALISLTTVAKSTIWQVKNSQTPVYLLGSIHVGKAEHYPLPPEVLDAFNQVDSIPVELDITKINQISMLNTIRKIALLDEGKSLKDVLDAKTYTRLQKQLGKTPVPMSDKMKPWMISQVMVLARLSQMGFSEKYGIDKFFIRKAVRLKKPVLELEKLDTQLKALSSFEQLDQNLLINQTLDQLPDIGDVMEQLFINWRHGNLEKITEFTQEQFPEKGDYTEINKLLLYDRNKQMSDKIDGYIKDKKSILVIAGAAHFVGKDNIISILKSKGYDIEQL